MRGTILCSGDVCFGGGESGESGGVQIQGFQTEAAAAAFWSNLAGRRVADSADDDDLCAELIEHKLGEQNGHRRRKKRLENSGDDDCQ